MTEQTPITRPPAPTGGDKKSNPFKPSDYNPDLANTEMVKDLMAKLPSPAIVSKKFTVFQGLLKSLNHTATNKTFINTEPLNLLMEEVSKNSVNVDGFNIKNFWAYMMHPTFIIQGMPQTQATQEEQPGFFGRIMNRIRGKDNTQGAPAQ
jgi:hypothetical protein